MMRKARFPRRRIAWLGVFGALLLALSGSGGAHAQDESTPKQAAVQKIAEYGPVFLEVAQERYLAQKMEQQAWFRDFFLCIIPLLAFFSVALYPLVRSQTIRARLPNPPGGRLFRLYLNQGLILMIILMILGFALLVLQYWMGQLGAATNPQYVMEELTITHIVDNRQELVDNYTDIFARVADNLANSPDMSMLTIIVHNGQQLRNDPLIEGVVWLLELLWPLLSNMFVIIVVLVALSFLRRLWPDIQRMLRFPLDIIAAERVRGPGPPAAPRGVSAQMWAEGRRLIWLELRVIGVFLVASVFLSFFMRVLLELFLRPLITLLVNVFSVAMRHFVSYDGAASVTALTLVLIGVFLVECFVLLAAMFFLLVRRTMGIFRRRFQREIMWREVWRLLGRQLGRFGLVAGLTLALGIATVVIADLTGGFFIGDLGQQGLGLLIVPIILLLGFNLGFWLGRGARIMRAMW
ncbi:MAG TPA: hypothetical protein VD886_25365 [Herpetosiphonaceae bacterium]|nr:hypothetical protein [Herpetosiphonaceae bacterium]